MLRLLRTRSCIRCGGNLSLERDEYGAYITCIQCGAVWNELEPAHSGQAHAEHRLTNTGKTRALKLV